MALVQRHHYTQEYDVSVQDSRLSLVQGVKGLNVAFENDRNPMCFSKERIG